MSGQVQSLAAARADLEGRFLIARRGCLFTVYERDGSGFLTAWHESGISREGAERLRADLIAGKAPTDCGPEIVAQRYEIAAATEALVAEGGDPWTIAMRIAARQPWGREWIVETSGQDDPGIPF